jgi:hypothetical protein
VELCRNGSILEKYKEYFWLLSPRVGVEQFLGGYIWLVYGGYMEWLYGGCFVDAYSQGGSSINANGTWWSVME